MTQPQTDAPAETAGRPEGTSAPALVLSHATLGYDSAPIVHDLTLQLAPGQALALVGSNGSGKTTVLQALVGLVRVMAGSVRVFGGEPREARTVTGYVPQTLEVDHDFPISVGQVVQLGLGPRSPLTLGRAVRRARRERAAHALARVGLEGFERRRFGELSGGQRQRVLVARAIVSGPRLLLLDEPFNGLDQASRTRLIRTLNDLKRDGVTVVVSTHDDELAREVCEWTLRLVDGTGSFGPTRTELAEEAEQ